MIASSTTSPIAITRPARTIVLIVVPIARRITPAATSESGMAVRLIRAVRQSNRKPTRITITRPQPTSIEWPRLSIDRWMNVAGRKIVGSTSTPLFFRSSVARAFSTFRVTSSELPCGCFSTIRSRPGRTSGLPSASLPTLMTASPMGGGKPIWTSATSPRRIGVPSRKATTVLRRSLGVSIAARCRTAIRWLGVSTNPPPATIEASATALFT